MRPPPSAAAALAALAEVVGAEAVVAMMAGTLSSLGKTPGMHTPPRKVVQESFCHHWHAPVSGLFSGYN